jgi:hypothetical protein
MGSTARGGQRSRAQAVARGAMRKRREADPLAGTGLGDAWD